MAEDSNGVIWAVGLFEDELVVGVGREDAVVIAGDGSNTGFVARISADGTPLEVAAFANQSVRVVPLDDGGAIIGGIYDEAFTVSGQTLELLKILSGTFSLRAFHRAWTSFG